MIKRMVVELDRDPALYADGNIVEVSCALTPSHYFSERSHIPLVATSTRSSQPLAGRLHCQTKR